MNIYFGENLKELRQKRNLTQERLADFLGVSFQTISKWERGDNYPDITMLPEIASFFKVSVDNLLGVNRAEDEKEINEQLYIYDNLTTSKQDRQKLIYSLNEKYPNDYRVLMRYMSYHIHFEDKYKSNSLIQSIYDNIINNCTDDDVRICTKRHMVQHYRNMAIDNNSGITLDDIEKIRSTMPYMRDGKDFVACYLYNEYHPKHYDYCKEALEEILGMLNLIVNNCCVWDYSVEHSGLKKNDNYIDYDIELINKMNTILEMFYEDNFGRQWHNVLDNYLHIGYLYSLKGDCEHAIATFQKVSKLAEKLDLLDDVTFYNSRILNGRKFDKRTDLGIDSNARLYVKKWIEERQEYYPEELTQGKDYKDILGFLKS